MPKKLNHLILPLLFSILLSTTANLKFGQLLNSITNTILSPITVPVGYLHLTTQKQISSIESFPQIQKDLNQTKNLLANLTSENQRLKDAIKEKETLQKLAIPYNQAIPIRLVNNAGRTTATTTGDIDSIKVGQPVVSGSILLGVVKEIKKPIIVISSLQDDSDPNPPLIYIKTPANAAGKYIYAARTPQIGDIPSQNPANLNDPIFTRATDLIPENLLLGRIVRIISTPQDPLQKAEIKLENSLENAPSLAIITKI